MFSSIRKLELIFICLFLLSTILISPAFAANYYVELSKDLYFPNEKVSVVVSGLSEKEIKEYAFVALFEHGSPDFVFVDYANVRELSNNTWRFSAPLLPGQYEIRLFSNGSTESLVSKTSFKVAEDEGQEQNSQQINFYGEPITTGVKLWWDSDRNAIGYRVFRALSANGLGVSVTDFYIESTEFIDVNVMPYTNYFYTLQPVYAEAAYGKGETLGKASDVVNIATTGDTARGTENDFIKLQIGNDKMIMNGFEKEVDPGRGTTPVIFSDRTMVPVRSIVEALGGEVGWDSASRVISLSLGTSLVEMKLDSTTMTVDGEEKEIDVPPTIINDRTMVPVRFAAENLNCKVDWINSTQEIIIIYNAEGYYIFEEEDIITDEDIIIDDDASHYAGDEDDYWEDWGEPG